MLISRISGCKGNGFYLIRKELSLIYFPQPFFQFAGPLAFVDEIVAESPAVSADGIGVQAGRYTMPCSSLRYWLQERHRHRCCA